MATTEQIEQAAADLGKMVAGHDSAKELFAAEDALEKDIEATRLLNDFNRHVQAVGQKQREQKPIEVEDKRKLEQLQSQIASNLLVRRLQLAQMNFLDLMRKVQALIATNAEGERAPSGAPTPAAPPPAAGPIIPQA
jgi:cell fate (sporulation/competence/biofilm development) regulator YlbF (YheA/YmcA/DUF963 family)